ncbi:hypothetical protein KOW79_006981 [Hemibagrus wyckioides]|uniref:Uncharacterized protein n=1 Tax=Hemibagrus wyckioides TaxID=337641 RepID=A0A9D3SLU3_9TELE|nr:hypothetical protein KOW79_006981 [Hemibagrus wyckioides]
MMCGLERTVSYRSDGDVAAIGTSLCSASVTISKHKEVFNHFDSQVCAEAANRGTQRIETHAYAPKRTPERYEAIRGEASVY